MRVLSEFLGAHLPTQGLLMVLCWVFRQEIVALYHIYAFTPVLSWYYLIGTVAFFWVLISLLRSAGLQTGLGRRAVRAGRSRGH